MENKDIRWVQRFNNYKKALSQLQMFVEKGKDLNLMEEQGMIQAFEYTYELAWNTVKDFFESQGESAIYGSRDAIQLAFKRGLIKDGEVWMKMLRDRNRSAHTYNQVIADEISEGILTRYFFAFSDMKIDLEKIAGDE